MQIWIQKLLLIQVFQRNRLVKQNIQLIQSSNSKLIQRLALTLFTIAYFLINYWLLKYSIMTKISHLTKGLDSTNSTIAGISFEILLYLETKIMFFCH